MLPNKENPGCLKMLYLLCKVFFKCNQIRISTHLRPKSAIDPWVNLFKTILDMPLPAELASQTQDQNEIIKRDKTIFWKIKGYAAKISNRLLIKTEPSRLNNCGAIDNFEENF